MSQLDYLKHQHMRGAISRREFMGRATALGASAGMLASMLASVDAYAAETPVKGGTLKIGAGGGSTTESPNPTTYTDSVNVIGGFAFMSSLVENGPDNKSIPELAQSFEAKPGAKEWVFNLRKGVQFSNGKEMDADDVIYSLNQHRGETKSGNAASMKAVADIKKLDKYQILVQLSSADADFPYILSDYHMGIIPNEFKDWANPVGTGAFVVEKYEAGVRVLLKKNKNYWKEGRGHLDAIEMTVINDAAARMNALISGQVHVINRVDTKLIALLKKAPGLEVVQAPGGWHSVMSMRLDTAPFDKLEVRQAMKQALDREQILKTLFSGYGTVGNDHPIPKGDPYFHTQLPQTVYDPDKAKALFKKAGLKEYKIELAASEAAFNGAVDQGLLLQASAAKADIKVDVKKTPADGFWDNVWLKASFAESYWAGRPAATQMLAVAYKSDAPWNECAFKNERFDKLLSEARSELDEGKRKKSIWDMQELLHTEGGNMIPAFRDWLDAHSSKVGGHTPHNGFDMNNGRIAEKAWLKA